MVLTISCDNALATDTPINTSASFTTSSKEPSILSLLVHFATTSFVGFIPYERPSKIAPLESHITIFLTPYAYNNLTIAIPAAPAPLSTTFILAKSLFTTLKAFTKPAIVTIAVPC